MRARDLIDFPVSWDWWRHYYQYYDDCDPGPNEPPEYTLEELAERVSKLEEDFDARGAEI